MLIYNLMLFLNQEVSDRPLAIFAFFAPVWTALQAQWSGFLISNAILLVTLFWFTDVILGSTRAMIDGRFDPSKIANGCKRLMLWFFVLAVAWGIRIGIPGVGNIIASIIEAVVLLSEGASILRNLSLFSNDARAKKLLTIFADKIEDRVDDLVDDISEEADATP